LLRVFASRVYLTTRRSIQPVARVSDPLIGVSDHLQEYLTIRLSVSDHSPKCVRVQHLDHFIYKIYTEFEYRVLPIKLAPTKRV